MKTKYSAHESLAISTTAVAFTAGTVGSSSAAVVTVEGAAVRFTVDGTTVTASVGHALEPGDSVFLDTAEDCANFSAISRDGGTATLKCSFGVTV